MGVSEPRVFFSGRVALRDLVLTPMEKISFIYMMGSASRPLRLIL